MVLSWEGISESDVTLEGALLSGEMIGAVVHPLEKIKSAMRRARNLAFFIMCILFVC